MRWDDDAITHDPVRMRISFTTDIRCTYLIAREWLDSYLWYIFFDIYDMGDCSELVFYDFPRSVMPTWRSREVVRLHTIDAVSHDHVRVHIDIGMLLISYGHNFYIRLILIWVRPLTISIKAVSRHAMEVLRGEEI
jgi:hypothetical protein